jgi:NAD(P)-dependent dehydrogenase (short-subunit alcohol dehydrogenase family)
MTLTVDVHHHILQSNRSAAVTGAGSGLGRDIALGLAARNYRVFGTALSIDEVADLKQASNKNWVREVETVAEGLDLLINNAGVLTPGPLEVLLLTAIRREFDVNVFGALAVINAFLPALRRNRGRIVQISTWTATLPLPFNGPSGASKAAMEVFATVYRAELKRFGIDVVVAAAGNMRTGGPAKTAAALKGIADRMSTEQRRLYGTAFDAFAANLNSMQESGLDSVAAATRVIEIAEQTPAPSKASVGADSDEILRFVREHSDAEQDARRLQIAGLKQ